MKLISNRAGKLITHPTQYKYFYPTSLFDVQIKTDNEMSKLLSEANLWLGKLDGCSYYLPNQDIFISMYVQKEATISSQIEGTQATLVDVLQSRCSNGLNRKDINDIVNYTNALNEGINLLKSFPLSTRLFNKLHEIMLKNTRGEDKQPGQYRISQNWIGSKGCSLNTASYIPVCPENLNECMNDLEKYINDETISIQQLIKIALIHYQFETIHPYLDGNGRVGRILIPLYLLNSKTITAPLLYLSLFFKENRSQYYSLLNTVRSEGDYEKWIKFFLKGIIEVSKNSIETISKVHNLKQKITKQIDSLNYLNSKYLIEAINFMFKQPYFNSSELKKYLNLSKPTITKIIKILLNATIITKKDNKERNSTYCFTEYVNILKPGTEL